jgi:hypothetical protein
VAIAHAAPTAPAPIIPIFMVCRHAFYIGTRVKHVELVDKLTWGVASVALTAIKKADCVGFEKHNRPIGDPHLQDENRMNRISFRCKCQWRLPWMERFSSYRSRYGGRFVIAAAELFLPAMMDFEMRGVEGPSRSSVRFSACRGAAHVTSRLLPKRNSTSLNRLFAPMHSLKIVIAGGSLGGLFAADRTAVTAAIAALKNAEII